MKVEHRKWADYVVSGKTPAQAYMLVYPDAGKKTASNRGGALMKNEELKCYIEERLNMITKKVDEHITNVIAEAQVGTILTAASKREILAKIISGEFETEKIVIVKGVAKKIKCKPDLADVMKAIEIDNKMSGDTVQAKPNQVAKAEEVTKVIVIEDQTQATQNPNGGDY